LKVLRRRFDRELLATRSNVFPDCVLVGLAGSFHPQAGERQGTAGAKLFRFALPAALLDAIRSDGDCPAGWNDNVFTNHAILFAADEHFAGHDEKRGTGSILDAYLRHNTGLNDIDLAAADAFIEGEVISPIEVLAKRKRKYGKAPVMVGRSNGNAANEGRDFILGRPWNGDGAGRPWGLRPLRLSLWKIGIQESAKSGYGGQEKRQKGQEEAFHGLPARVWWEGHTF